MLEVIGTMAAHVLNIIERPKLRDACMVLGFSGWMDGGDVSTGTVDYLVAKLDAPKIAEIDPEEFYIYNFPGSMEVSSLFRPHSTIEDGLITALAEPTNAFFCSQEHNLVLFEGREPNFRWRTYADCIFSLAAELDVDMMCFVGSVSGLVPHTREPRIHASVSEARLKPLLEQHDLAPSNYEGPASFITYLTAEAKQRGLWMVNLVVEIPAYVQGKNIKCVEVATRKVADVLRLSLDLSDLRLMGEQFVQRLNETLAERPDLAEQIRNIEEDYDKEVVTTEETDLKTWFEKQDIRLD